MSLKCSHCGKIDWKRAPKLYKAYNLLLDRGELKSSDLVDELSIKIQSASNMLSKLGELGLAQKVKIVSPSGGGRAYVWRWTRDFVNTV